MSYQLVHLPTNQLIYFFTKYNSIFINRKKLVIVVLCYKKKSRGFDLNLKIISYQRKKKIYN